MTNSTEITATNVTEVATALLAKQNRLDFDFQAELCEEGPAVIRCLLARCEHLNTLQAYALDQNAQIMQQRIDAAVAVLREAMRVGGMTARVHEALAALGADEEAT